MSTFSIRICWLITSLMLAASYSQDMPPLDEIREKMRPDHPRLYFNRDTWSHVKSRAFGAEKDYYAKVRSAITSTPRKGWIQVPLPEPHKNSTVATADWGRNLMRAAFVYRAEPTPELLVKIKDMFRTSLAYYHAYYEAGQAVDWYGFSRICWLAAFDWVWDDLTAEERREFGVSMLEHMRQIMHKPGIVRRNGSGHTTGYYGANSCMWYAGVVFHQAGMDDTLANECLEYGYDRYSKLLAHRRLSCGDDGGAASVTVTYSYGAYPLAEWNFLHTLESATGFDIAANWPYIGMSCNYLDWNMLPGKLEYGYGDTPHLHNRFPTSRLYLHMSQTMHFYADSRPDLARLAKYTRDKVGGRFSTYDMSVFPFLLHRLDSVKKAMDMKGLPHARNFTNMGQIFMRSGTGPDDTYALFACGGISRQHRHYDQTHFTIFKRGYLALDTGTRAGNTDNLQNYYAQTVAHNCVLVNMPDEPPASYWNGKVFSMDGGQHKSVGANLLAFETGPEFTYVAADATPVYRAEKCSWATRQFLFVMPDFFVVFDRVSSIKPTYVKRWLLHHAREPVLEARTWRSDQAKGRLFCRTLLPEDAVLEKIGGPGREFLVNGVNYPIDQGPSKQIQKRGDATRAIPYKETPELIGRWRMEVRGKAPVKDEVFLHLIQVGDQELERMTDCELVRNEKDAGVRFTVDGKIVTVTFARVGEVGARIEIRDADGTVRVDRMLTREVTPQQGLAQR